MAENIVEILIRARNEAMQAVNQASSGLQQVVRAQDQLVDSSGRAERSSISFRREVGAAASSARFLGFTLIGELSPALGTTGSRLASLASVASLGGNAMTALAVVTGGALVIALTSYFQAAKKAKEAQEELTKAVSTANVATLTKVVSDSQKEIAELTNRIEALQGLQKLGAPVADTLEAAQLRLAEALGRQEKANVGLNLAMKVLVETQGQASELSKKKALADLHEEVQTVALTEATRELAEVTDLLNKARGRPLHVVTAEETTKAAQEELAELERSLRDAEEQAGSSAEFAAGESAERIDKIFREIRQRSDTFVNAMTSVGNAGADALFDGLIGRSRSLGETFKSFLEGLARDLFRNTFVKAFGGEARGLSLQNLMSLGGGGSPFGSVAMAAGVPGTAGVDVATRAASAAEIEARGAGGLFTTEAPGLSFGQFAGAAGTVGLGALGILAAGRAQTPLSGGIAGGLGGYAIGSGLGTMFQAGSYIPYIGAAFAVAGAVYGLVSGSRAQSKRRREEQRQRRAQAQILVVEGADTLEELEALSTGIPEPSFKFGTIIHALEPEAMAALRQRATGLILQAGQEEIAATGSLAGIRAIRARGVSPDVGGVELRAAAQARELEILQGLEAIGGISIEEQLPGGVRRRTLVGAGAFGRARARAARGEIILGATEFRQMLRATRQSAPELFDEMLRFMLDRAGARGIRLEAARL
jgi:hypothetical protein